MCIRDRNYLREAYAVVRQHGGLCIADEVQTDFGRTGDHYWGFENFDVVPDIVVMAKGIGNGVPLAAVTTRAAKAETLQLLEAAREMGVLIGKGGIDGNVIRMKPPMCITAEDADYALEVM